MRLFQSQPADLVGESLDGYNLVRAAVVDADVLTRVYQAFYDEEYSPISAILGEKGYFTQGLREGTWTSKMHTVGSNHVMYPIASSQKRKIIITANENGISYSSSAFPTKPGYRGTPFFVYTNNNWLRPSEVMELGDNRTQIYAYSDEEPLETSGVFRYEMKLVTNDYEDYVDIALLAPDSEGAAVMTLYEHDWSETGSEKYTFDAWGHAYLTLQRVKMSVSGNAEAMQNGRNWYAFRNSKGEKKYTFIDKAYNDMLKRAAKYHEYQMIFGKTTVTQDGQVFLHKKNGREVMAGSGLIYGVDGCFESPMPRAGWSLKFLESKLRDVDIRAGKEGHKEVILCGGFSNIASFNAMMRQEGFKPFNNYVAQGIDGKGERGVSLDYDWFEWMGIRIIPVRYRHFDSEDRPQRYLPNGDTTGSWESLMIPIGITAEGDNMIELVQLRPPKTGTVNGINKGGEDMASSVDGKSIHYLWQTGCISRTVIHRIFMPYAK